MLITAAAPVFGATLTGVRQSSDSEKIRLVFDFDSAPQFKNANTASKITIDINDSTAIQGLSEYKMLDALLGTVSIKDTGGSLKIIIPTNYHVESSTFALKEPDRLVVDIKRQEIKQEIKAEKEEPEEIKNAPDIWTANPAEPATVPKYSQTLVKPKWFSKSQTIADGLYYLPVDQEIDGKFVRTHAALIDPCKFDITPVIVVPQIKMKDNIPVFTPLFDFLGGIFGAEKDDKYYHFTKRTVKTFVNNLGGGAGINGTFFGPGGTPLGVLIINGQLVSSPIYNRTALIINKDGSAKIDPVRMDGYLKLQNGQTLGFSGINQPVGHDQIIVYTPYYQTTDPSGASTNIVVEDDKVTNITCGETRVPGNGFIVSANGVAGEAIKDDFRIGDTVKWFFITAPAFDNIKHVIGGGPRLVYRGEVNVTAADENFRNDIAKGRAARTAVGITKNGEMIFAVVEKNTNSAGATLEELAKLMVKLGAYEALNFDGGGSSAMVINNTLVNRNSPRPVSNAIVVKAK